MSDKKEPSTLELVTRINRALSKIATPKATVVLGMLNSLHDERSSQEQNEFSENVRAAFLKHQAEMEVEKQNKANG